MADVRFACSDFEVYRGKFDVNTTVFRKIGVAADPNTGENVYDGVREVLITHGHADHFGDALFLEGKVRIVAPRHETPLIENPEINWRGMYSWAKLPEDVVTPYFLGRGVRVDAFAEDFEDFKLERNGRNSCSHEHPGWKAIKMPGHTPSHTAYLVDSVLVMSDALHCPDYWEKFGILYYVDPDRMGESLLRAKDLDWDYVIPGHGDIFDSKEGRRVIDVNLRMLERMDREIYELVRSGGDEGVEEVEVFATLARRYGFRGVKAVLVVMPPVRGHLTSMCERGILELFEEDGRIRLRVREGYRKPNFLNR